ncbi:hypothetical protein GMOD_00006870 [Pyrenophora seminiperda CCB06]|uniref:Uncharacterized protein n=1 Tax=Pyrenophora seminiperda CCB06 TaxID=1302712 RepID=A0A3M7MB34_9PLEO|nr:hypothetical protein GMOD_00006870 [Pyrenophora seminiperda CCB06]
MPGMLMRSKSLRFLRNNRNDPDNGKSMQPAKASQTGLDKYKLSTPSSGPDMNLDSLHVPVRPNTSGGPGDRSLMSPKTDHPALPDYPQDNVHSFQSPTTSTTVLYTADVRTERGVIGIALGSPTFDPNWKVPPQAVSTMDLGYTASPMTMMNHQNESLPSLATRPDAPKSKFSRWKSMFRKAAPPEQDKASFYQVTQAITTASAVAEPVVSAPISSFAPRADSHHDQEALEAQTPLKEGNGREKLRTVSPPTYKHDIRASRKWTEEEFTAPESPPETTVTRGRTLKVGKHSFHLAHHMAAPRSEQNNTPAPQTRNTQTASQKTATANEGPLLDVSLPDVTMERYSVMFENFLQFDLNQFNPSQQDPNRLSLLARRQGNNEKVQPLTELSAKVLIPLSSVSRFDLTAEQDVQPDFRPVEYRIQRRGTSPVPVSSSPRLSLFPAPSPTHAPSTIFGSPMSRSETELKRSRTMPGKSPLRQNHAQNKDSPGLDSARLMPTASPYPKGTLTPTSFLSSDSEADAITFAMAKTATGQDKPLTLRLDDREPEWTICSVPAKAAERGSPMLANISTSSLVRTLSQNDQKITKHCALRSNPSSPAVDAPPMVQRLASVSAQPHPDSPLAKKRAEIQARRAAAAAAKKDDVTVIATAKATVGVARSVSVSRANSIARSVSVSRANSPRSFTSSPSASPMDDRSLDRLALTPTMVEVRSRKSQRVQLSDP